MSENQNNEDPAHKILRATGRFHPATTMTTTFNTTTCETFCFGFFALASLLCESSVKPGMSNSRILQAALGSCAGSADCGGVFKRVAALELFCRLLPHGASTPSQLSCRTVAVRRGRLLVGPVSISACLHWLECGPASARFDHKRKAWASGR